MTWRLLLAHDNTGSVLAGAKADLVRAVHDGIPVRVARLLRGDPPTVPYRKLVMEIGVIFATDQEVHAQSQWVNSSVTPAGDALTFSPPTHHDTFFINLSTTGIVHFRRIRAGAIVGPGDARWELEWYGDM